jgi:TRAP transporter TAXI family solute receptor
MTPRILAVLGCLALIPAAGPALAQDTGAIVAGSPDSTAFRFGQDIAELVGHFDVALAVVPTQGGLQNIEALARNPEIQLGIVPSDVRDFVASFSEDQELRPMAGLQLVFPLFAQEVHVLARHEVRTLADLQGKRVAMGAPGSGTLLTATMLLGTAGIEPAEEVRIDGEEALDALRAGRVDAMFHVAGQPSPLLLDQVAIEDALHLVPVDHPALRGFYPQAVIPADTYYPWQPQDVPTVAPKAMLATLPWTERDNQAACRLVGKVARIVADNLDRLRREGHPKWREVDPGAAPASGWERSPCVERALAGPEGYVLDDAQAAMPASAPPPPAVTLTAAPERAAQTDGEQPTHACSAEDNPILRRLCTVRPLLGPRP